MDSYPLAIIWGVKILNTYIIPREATNENRFLFFSQEALIFTLLGFVCGLFFVGLFTILASICNTEMLKYIGWGICVLFSGIGYCLGAFRLPESNAFDFLKKAGGESVYTIVKRVIKFKRNRKIYIFERS